jgi:hypothetical protein
MNIIEDKIFIIILKDAEKSFAKIQHSGFYDKKPEYTMNKKKDHTPT